MLGIKKGSQNGCIDAKKVPCEKAREYLDKKGLLCGTHPDDVKPAKTAKPQKKKRTKSFFTWLFG